MMDNLIVLSSHRWKAFLITDEKCPVVYVAHEWRVHNLVVQGLSLLMESVTHPKALK